MANYTQRWNFPSIVRIFSPFSPFLHIFEGGKPSSCHPFTILLCEKDFRHIQCIILLHPHREKPTVNCIAISMEWVPQKKRNWFIWITALSLFYNPVNRYTIYSSPSIVLSSPLLSHPLTMGILYFYVFDIQSILLFTFCGVAENLWAICRDFFPLFGTPKLPILPFLYRIFFSASPKNLNLLPHFPFPRSKSHPHISFDGLPKRTENPNES